MTRRYLPRIAAAGVTIAAIVAALTAITGTGFAQSNAAQASYAPVNTAPPAIGGTPQVSQSLTASPGTWTSDTTPTNAYQWQRCNAQGASCAAISGASAQAYTVQSTDVGATLRVVVTATNTTGSTSATSAQTAVVADSGPAGAIKLPNGKTSIPAASATNRLVIDGVKFTPGRLTNRSPFTGRIHVSDTSGNVVRDVLVKITGLPYAWARSPAEAQTDQTGWATLTITPTRNLPLGGHNALVMFVRARVEGQPLLAGISNRRLVQVTVR